MEQELINKASLKTLSFYLLFFLSGFIALVYEVLWMKELGLLFGNTAYATATVLTAFFCGLGCGNYFWGKKADKILNPLRTYAYLELAIAVSAIGYFVILYSYRAIYPILFEYFFDYPSLFIISKFLLSLILLFPPAFFMGGTLPVMSQFLVQQKNWMGQRVSLLYTINTLGASCGTLIAGFVLPRLLGFQLSFIVAMSVNLLIAFCAFILSSLQNLPQEIKNKTTPGSELKNNNFASIAVIAFISGVITLSLQVLWVRMFSQILHNSVYSFSIILTVFLLILALGSWLASRLMKLRVNHESTLIVLLIVAGSCVISSPFILSYMTNGLDYVQNNQGWLDYILTILGIALLVMGPALLFLGAILPMTFKLIENNDASIGYLVGMLTSINTIGAVLGSLLAGFFLLEAVGLWQSIHIIACLCFATALFLTYRRFSESARWAPMTLGIVLFPAVMIDMSSLPTVKLAESVNEKLLEVWEGSAGTVAVTESRKLGGLRIKVNNHYNLGGSGASVLEELQTDIPMQLHPNPEDVYVLGLGSGITAGAALKYPLKKLTVTELVPDVIVASRKHFKPFLHGLFTDKRAKVIAEDGRNYLEGSQQQFDVIIADLFVPWRAGAGYLYTQEHFKAVSQRLKDDGLFMQWLPSHQLTKKQFNIITHTFLKIFPQVTLWRGDFIYGVSLVGILGQKQPSPFLKKHINNKLNVAGLESFDIPQLPLLSYYAGNLGEQKQSFEKYALNLDDFPVIVYDSPITQRQKLANKIKYLAGYDLVKTIAAYRKHVPTANDPYLSQLSTKQKQLVGMGDSLHLTETRRATNSLQLAKKEYKRFAEIYNIWKQAPN